ncbi:MAG: hypothetical protein AB8C46_16820 [Burkholderiaceae bacterium]
MRLHVVSATRRSRESFWGQGALGLSLRRLAHDDRIVPWIAYENSQGLPDIYNQLLQPGIEQGAVVFIHDDVWLDDGFFVDRLFAGLEQFDVLGLAGNRRRVPRQPGWAFTNEAFEWDDRSNLSGLVGHGEHAFGKLTHYGAAPAACELLDGIMLAANVQTLIDHDCRFDPTFKFHFYDLDFCRTARDRQLRLGTWPLSVTHQSGGAFGTEGWWHGYQNYLAKWQA